MLSSVASWQLLSCNGMEDAGLTELERELLELISMAGEPTTVLDEEMLGSSPGRAVVEATLRRLSARGLLVPSEPSTQVSLALATASASTRTTGGTSRAPDEARSVRALAARNGTRGIRIYPEGTLVRLTQATLNGHRSGVAEGVERLITPGRARQRTRRAHAGRGVAGL